jgi:hypothetical protein
MATEVSIRADQNFDILFPREGAKLSGGKRWREQGDFYSYVLVA